VARIPLTSRADLDEDARAAWDDIARVRGDVPISYQSLFNSPGAADGIARLGAYLRFESDLDPRVRELAVLVVNAETGCEFGWVHHALLADKMGVSPETIGDIHAGRPPRGLGEREQLGVDAARQTLRSGGADADTVAALVREFGAAGATDLIVAIGYYTMLAQYFRTLDLEATPEGMAHLTGGADVARAAAGPDRDS
jgi:4-carboxymuconolactone decarboxylase